MKKLYRILLCLLALSLLTVNAFAETVEPSGEGPANASAIASVADVPLITLNNGV